jgi:DNA repair exonuclease SbcCD ATPase subunit
MRFESVSAVAFGPFKDEKLTFAPGMNVVHGSNESGKSSWHAALYAGLCGMRRGAGVKKEDRLFTERHRPWDGDGSWEVGATIALEDGRRVQLRHELVSRVNCDATDAVIANRDYSSEIMHEGAPDGSRWLGLDRRSFLSTACVRQTDIVGILHDDHADDLQDQLQRAASTAGTDATAARALEELENFLATNVGSERAPTRPLQSARLNLARARRAADEARASHAEYLARLAGVDQLERRVRDLDTAAVAARLVVTEDELRAGEERLSRVRELTESFAAGPPRATTEDDRVRRVALALQSWEGLVMPPEPSGRSLFDLQQDLDRLAAGREQQEVSEQGVAARESGRSAELGVAGVLVAVVGVALALGGALLVGVPLLAVGIAVSTWWLSGRHRNPVADAGAVATGQTARILEQQIEARIREDELYESGRTEREEAERLLYEVSAAIGDARHDPDQQAVALHAWEDSRHQELELVNQAQELWDELQRLLGDRSPEDLALEVEGLRSSSAELPAQILTEDPAAAEGSGRPPADAGQLDADAEAAHEDRARALGELEEFAQGLPDVAGAEEDVAVAEREAARIEDLDKTVRATIELLERAEERVHRDIAPVLRGTIMEWLPRVTGGRYTDCRVDPDSLVVEVSGDDERWYQADRLSHGTSEQLYLLLRLALTRHLTRQGEVCPLILDDVVGASDGDRKREILDTLLSISEWTQVILFTHEEDVLSWAREQLVAPRDSTVDLDAAGTPV